MNDAPTTFSDWLARAELAEAERLNRGSYRASEALELKDTEKPVALPSWTWPEIALLGAFGAFTWLGLAWAAGWLS